MSQLHRVCGRALAPGLSLLFLSALLVHDAAGASRDGITGHAGARTVAKPDAPKETEPDSDGQNTIEPADEIDISGAPPSLDEVEAVLPTNLSDFIPPEKFDAAVKLGKVLFWDVQVGSDGMTACASCHYHAGSNARFKNTLAPGAKGEFAELFSGLGGGPNYTLDSGDFPFHRLLDPSDADSKVLTSIDDVVGAAGVHKKDFGAIALGSADDVGSTVPDPIFHVGGINVRQSTGRQAPTVLGAIFLHRNFWDGRANFFFNGRTVWGDTEPTAPTVLCMNDEGELDEVEVLIDFASTASQAVGPPPNATEMSWDGRSFMDIGRKMLSLPPLAKQVVHPEDSVLADCANPVGNGLIPEAGYEQLIMEAFDEKWWGSSELVDGYTHMEANFSLIFGLAILCYESTLRGGGDSDYDRFMEGDKDALTKQQIEGLDIFINRGNCFDCHGGSEFAGATISQVFPGLAEIDPETGKPVEDLVGVLERMGMEDHEEENCCVFATNPKAEPVITAGMPVAQLLDFDPRDKEVSILHPGGAPGDEPLAWGVASTGGESGYQGGCPEGMDIRVDLELSAALSEEAAEKVEASLRLVDDGCCGMEFEVCLEWEDSVLPSGLYPVVVDGEIVCEIAMGRQVLFQEQEPYNPCAPALACDPRDKMIKILPPGDSLGVAPVAYGYLDVPGPLVACPEGLDVTVDLDPGPNCPPGYEDDMRVRVRLFVNEGECGMIFEAELVGLPYDDYRVVSGIFEMGTVKPMAGDDAVYDAGFYNIGVRPTCEDLGVGASGPYGPLSLSERAQQGQELGFPLGIDPAPQPGERVAVRGAFKTPTVRNIWLTGPYMRNGGMLTLEQVVDFYSRGADFAVQNRDDLDPRVSGIGGMDKERKAALVAFLKSLTDHRVLIEAAPYDHPSLPLRHGHPTSHLFAAENAADPGNAEDLVELIPETGKYGGAPLLPFHERLAPSITVYPTYGLEAVEGESLPCGLEGLAKNQFSIVLDKPPLEDVEVECYASLPAEVVLSELTDPEDLGTLSTLAAPLVFTPDNWMCPRVVTVVAADDGVIDGDKLVTVSFGVTSLDAQYAGYPMSDVTVRVVDDGMIAVPSTTSSPSTAEDTARPRRRPVPGRIRSVKSR